MKECKKKKRKEIYRICYSLKCVITVTKGSPEMNSEK
jgi:hypothetical protein